MNKVTFVVPFSNEEVLKRWFLRSPLEDCEIIKLQVSKEKSASFQLNEILDVLKKKQWLVFCEEWVRLLKNVSPFLEGRSKNVLYGITGARLRKDDNKLQIFDGRSGYQMIDNKVVDSLGQGCIIIHASALKKFDLKFDENFVEKYMVDFSLQCSTQGMKLAILSLNCRFRERISPYSQEEIFRDRLRKKYHNLLPIGLFSGTLTENSELDLKSLLNQRENWISTLIKEKSQLTSKVNEYEKIMSDLTGSANGKKNFQKYDENKSSILEKKLFDDLESKLVWIFGSPRSGSTWLAHDILRREGIRSLDETMFGAQLGAFYDTPAPHWALIKGRYKAKFTRIIDRDKDDLFFSTKFEKVWKDSLRFMILNRIKAQFGFTGYKYVVLKSPNESHASDIMLKCLPKSKLIFLVRDGRDVIDSRQGKFHNPRGIMSEPETPEERKFRMSHFAVMWNLMIETTQRAYDSHDPELRLLVRYEDLRLDPLKEIGHIYKFLGYDLSEQEIEKIADITSFENVPQELKGEDKNLRQAKPGGFKKYFTGEELRIANKIMKENLLKYGYEI